MNYVELTIEALAKENGQLRLAAAYWQERCEQLQKELEQLKEVQDKEGE